MSDPVRDYMPLRVRRLRLRRGACEVRDLRDDARFHAHRELRTRHIRITDAASGTDVLMLRAGRRFPLRYSVIEAGSGHAIAHFAHAPLRSLVREQWHWHAADHTAIGTIAEDTLRDAVQRRILDAPLQRELVARLGDEPVFVLESDGRTVGLRFLPAAEGRVDPKTGLAAAVILTMRGPVRRLMGGADV